MYSEKKANYRGNIRTQDLNRCVDIEKTFDRIDWQIMFSIMNELNLDFKDRRIIYN
jgi:hypothetical protein